MYFCKSLNILTGNAFPEKKFGFLRIESDFAILRDLICDGGVNFVKMKVNALLPKGNYIQNTSTTFKIFLLQNHWNNFNQSWHYIYLG